MIFANSMRYTSDKGLIARVRPSHREYARGLLAEGKLIVAGSYPDDSGGLFIYWAHSLEEAELLMANDPYVPGGVIDSHVIKEWEIHGVRPELLTVTKV